MQNYKFLTEYGCVIKENCNSLSHFRSGGKIKLACFPRDIQSLLRSVEELIVRKEKYVVIGNGTNILFRDDGYDGFVICTHLMKEKNVSEDGIWAECGASLPSICLLAKKNNLSGLEGLADIPASLGGAIANNAGAFGYQICDRLDYIDIFDGEQKRLTKKDLQIEYHKCVFPKDCIILGAKVVLEKGDCEEIEKKMANFHTKRALTQPHSLTLGSVFGRVGNISAGYYIEKAGFKGKRIGNVQVSNVHANFFENLGGAKTNDFLALGNLIMEEVDKQLGIALKYEIEIID